MQHRNMKVWREFFTFSDEVSCVCLCPHTWWRSRRSIGHPPDNDTQYNQSNGTHHSKNTHPSAGLLLEQKNREKTIKQRAASESEGAADPPGSRPPSGAALSLVPHELQHFPHLPQYYLNEQCKKVSGSRRRHKTLTQPRENQVQTGQNRSH